LVQLARSAHSMKRKDIFDSAGRTMFQLREISPGGERDARGAEDRGGWVS